MKCAYTLALLGSALLVACGGETEAPKAAAKASKGHYFNQPYECSSEKDVTSKQTGKTRTVKYRSYYSPQKGWRIDLSGVEDSSALAVANLYTPTARYDGTFKEVDGVITRVKFGTAWPRKSKNPNVAVSNLSKKKKNDCKVLNDASIFDIEYLDTLEVMGQ